MAKTGMAMAIPAVVAPTALLAYVQCTNRVFLVQGRSVGGRWPAVFVWEVLVWKYRNG